MKKGLILIVLFLGIGNVKAGVNIDMQTDLKEFIEWAEKRIKQLWHGSDYMHKDALFGTMIDIDGALSQDNFDIAKKSLNYLIQNTKGIERDHYSSYLGILKKLHKNRDTCMGVSWYMARDLVVGRYILQGEESGFGTPHPDNLNFCTREGQKIKCRCSQDVRRYLPDTHSCTDSDYISISNEYEKFLSEYFR